MELISIMYSAIGEMLLKNNCNDWSSICSFVCMERFVLVVSTAEILNVTIGPSIKRVETSKFYKRVVSLKKGKGEIK